MGAHFYCDVCRQMDPTKKGVTDRDWRIEDDDFLIHLSTHSIMELILYAKYVTGELYHFKKYEVEE
jgi:hypothetical protein